MPQAEKVFLVHGWSVDETTTYQALHLKLAKHGFALHDLFLGRYVSLDNEVEIKDIAQAMHNALIGKLGRPPWSGRFHIITHSTGALVVKQWAAEHYVGKFSAKKPLKNLIFLAGPHFGSRLAHHGRSMLAHGLYMGETGKNILKSLELGSDFSWENNGRWLEPQHWREKGIRPFCLIGDRVEKSFFKSKIFPAGYEEGSDMVVRVAAANLNFRRYLIDRQRKRPKKIGEIKGIPFGILADFVHSEDKHGIMNNITTAADPRQKKYLNLKLILQCLKVKSKADYQRTYADLAAVTANTRRTRRKFAQLDFHFRDKTGAPIDDYCFALGELANGREKPSAMVTHVHKNEIDGSRLTVFLDLKHIQPQRSYFFEINSDSGTMLYRYHPDPYRRKLSPIDLAEIIRADHTTQIEVVLDRKSDQNLFVFHGGNDPQLHVRWNREGRITKKNLAIK